MATLNVKQVPDALYALLKAQARRHHRSLAQEVVHLLASAVHPPSPSSWADMQGIAAADPVRDAHLSATEFVRRERDSWT